MAQYLNYYSWKFIQAVTATFMILFIGNIPAHSTERDFSRFMSKAGSGPLAWLPFGPRPVVRQCQVLCIQDEEKNSVEFQGPVAIQPVKSSQSLLRRLDGKKFNGKPVEVRRYFKRSFRMDRRIIHTDPESLSEERRQGDRRRAYLKTQVRPC